MSPGSEGGGPNARKIRRLEKQVELLRSFESRRWWWEVAKGFLPFLVVLLVLAWLLTGKFGLGVPVAGTIAALVGLSVAWLGSDALCFIAIIAVAIVFEVPDLPGVGGSEESKPARPSRTEKIASAIRRREARIAELRGAGG